MASSILKKAPIVGEYQSGAAPTMTDQVVQRSSILHTRALAKSTTEMNNLPYSIPFSERYLSASIAAIQPDPAATTA